MKKFIIEISSSDFHYKQDITDTQKAKIISFLMLPDIALEEDREGLTATNTEIPVQIGSTSSSFTLGEYMVEHKATTIPQKIATTLLYIREALGKPSATINEVRSQFELAREVMPANFSRDFNTTISKNWLSLNPEGEYYLTITGERAVINKFIGMGGNRGARKRVLGKKRITLTVRDTVEKLDLVALKVGLKDYWTLNKADRILWLLTVANKGGVENLNSKEISRLAARMQDSILPKQIASLTSKHIKEDKLQPDLQDNIRTLRILNPGIIYVSGKREG